MITKILVPNKLWVNVQETNSGVITLSQQIRDFTVNFPTSEQTQFVKLTVYKADFGAIGNFVLTEFIITGLLLSSQFSIAY